MIVYQIKKWAESFETHQSRGRIKGALPWVKIPTDNGVGYRRLMRSPDGPAIYGIWVALVRVAAAQSVRGVLARSDGSALSLEDLEDLTDVPASLIAMAIGVLSSERIGWLEPKNDERADLGLERADSDLERADLAPDRADTAQIVPLTAQAPRRNGQICAIEKRRGDNITRHDMRGDARAAHDQPMLAQSGEDIFDGSKTEEANVNPFAHFTKLKAYGLCIPRSDKDDKDQRGLLLALIEIHGIAKVHATAEAMRHQGRKSFFIWELQAEIDASTPQPAQRDDDIPEPAPECVAAVKLAKQIGFTKVQEVLGFQAREGDMQFICQALANNPPACVELLKANGVTW